MSLSLDSLYKLKLEDGILYGEFLISSIDIDQAKEIIKSRVEYCKKNGEFPVCIDISKVKKVTRDARVFMSSPEANEGVTAAAIIAPNGFAKALANFFIRVNLMKPIVPTKMFANLEEASKWLEQFKK